KLVQRVGPRTPCRIDAAFLHQRDVVVVDMQAPVGHTDVADALRPRSHACRPRPLHDLTAYLRAWPGHNYERTTVAIRVDTASRRCSGDLRDAVIKLAVAGAHVSGNLIQFLRLCIHQRGGYLTHANAEAPTLHRAFGIEPP